MPALYEHLYAASAACTLLLPKSLPQYYLGSVLPDSVNLSGFASKAVRSAAHLRDKDLCVWQQNIKAYFAESALCSESLKLGVIVHCTTDLCWDEYFEQDFVKALASSHPAPSKEALFELRWGDHYAMDGVLRKTATVQSALSELSKATGEAACTISAAVADKMKVHTCFAYAQTLPEVSPLVLSPKMIAALSEKVCDKLKQICEK